MAKRGGSASNRAVVRSEAAAFRLLNDGDLRATVIGGVFEHARRHRPAETAAWLETMARNLNPAGSADLNKTKGDTT